MAHADAHAIHPEPVTGIDNRKLAIWTFIGSECLFFASLIGTYLVYRGRDTKGPFPHAEWTDPATGKLFEPIFEIPLVTFGTAVLLFSSFFVVLALSGAQEGNRRKLLTWLGLTITCGLFFVGMQVYEFTHFVHKGLTLQQNLFGTTFYTLTGFHGTHVTLGVIWLGALMVEAVRGKLTAERALNLEIAALYWHFVDVVWIVIFPVVYLMK
ncbi:MAG: cytochrome c oxidase subunit 3 [Gemmatimonadales bacterium]|nr:cytochrome c oxidase subunit 3 [Gemmatimonadales bacterium]